MARSYRPVVRDQEFLLPPNMADWLPEDHLAWFIIEVVDQLDTTGFHALRRTGGAGRRGYDPDMLLGLLVYAYAAGERSSRRIERLCATDVGFRVLCGQDAPDHSTIARFRGEHPEAFAELFAQVLRLCADAGMVKVGVVAIDGTKIAANAARGANRSSEWVREEARRIAAAAVAEAEEVDAAEDAAAAARGGRSEDDLPPGFATRKGRAANIKKALEELDRRDTEDAEADRADADRVAGLLARLEAGEPLTGPPPAGADPVAWAQARMTGLRRRVAELDGIRGVSKQRKDLTERVRRAEAALARAREQAAAGEVDLRGPSARARDRRRSRASGRGAAADPVNVTDPDSRLMTDGAGGGSVQGYNAQVAVTDDHLILGVFVSQDPNDTSNYLPTLAEAAIHAARLGKNIDLVLADAGYFTDANLTATGPYRLIAPGKNHHVTTEARENPADGPPPEDASPKDAMRHRLREPGNAERYKRRGATVEPVIAHLKDQTRLRRFARRGIQAVTAELNLAAAVINLTRLHQARLATG